jgi:hypothetical protein
VFSRATHQDRCSHKRVSKIQTSVLIANSWPIPDGHLLLYTLSHIEPSGNAPVRPGYKIVVQVKRIRNGCIDHRAGNIRKYRAVTDYHLVTVLQDSLSAHEHLDFSDQHKSQAVLVTSQWATVLSLPTSDSTPRFFPSNLDLFSRAEEVPDPVHHQMTRLHFCLPAALLLQN